MLFYYILRGKKALIFLFGHVDHMMKIFVIETCATKNEALLNNCYHMPK